MFKKVLAIALFLVVVVGMFGCTSSGNSTTKPPASIEYVREAKIGTTWQMKQIQLNFNTETSVTIELAPGDKVDGYYYVVSSGGIGFTISGISQIYASTSGATSDRFSFTASQEQGIDYKLKFTVGGSEANVFLELIYPVTGEVLVPIGTK